jgi:hypothetical protein
MLIHLVEWNVSVFGLKCYSPNMSLLILCLDNLSNIESSVLLSLYLLQSYHFSFRSFNICFTYLGVPMLGAHVIVIGSWWGDPFVTIQSLFFKEIVFDL